MKSSKTEDWILKELRRIRPLLGKGTRWMWGRHDALEDVLKKMEEEKEDARK